MVSYSNKNLSKDYLTVNGDIISPLHGSYHWTFERLLSLGTLSLIGMAAFSPSKIVDFSLSIVLPLHCHIGFGSIITDYLPNRKFPFLYKFSMIFLYGATITSIYGLYMFNTKSVGITEAIKSIWNAKKSKNIENLENN